jgi:VanZ family protein
MPASRALSVWLPVIVWAAVIFTFSSIPGLSTGLGGWDTLLRKGAHMTEYAILGALLLRALGRWAPTPPRSTSSSTPSAWLWDSSS